MNKNLYLVADLGGTNIRFAKALADSVEVTDVLKYSIRDYESIDHLIKVYLKATATPKSDIAGCCIAIAGPVNNNRVKMTNCDWEITTAGLNKALDIENSAIINDFHAIALAAKHLPTEGLVQIGAQAPDFSQGPVSVFGPGTGLGAALLYTDEDNRLAVIPTEGGHAGLSARSDEELFIFDYWRHKGCRINREFFVSGQGIERIFEALCVDNQSDDYKHLSVTNIQLQGCNRKDPLCEKAMTIFCSFLGSAAGDQVLCTGSTGGLILAGGILPRFVDFLQQSPFRKRYESKGAMSDYVKKTGTALIVDANPGLVGAAAYLNR